MLVEKFFFAYYQRFIISNVGKIILFDVWREILFEERTSEVL